MTKHITIALLVNTMLVTGSALAQGAGASQGQLEVESVDEVEAEREAATAPASGQSLYALGLDLSSYGSVLYRVNDFASDPYAQVVGASEQELFDVAIDPSTGRFYGIGPDGYLYELSAATGSASEVGFTGRYDLNALEFDGTGQGWAAGSSGGLYKINKTYGTATLIGALGFDSGGDLAFDPSGTLFGTTNSQLLRINKSTGAGTLVGPLGFSGAFGLEIDSGGTMYVGRGNDFTGLAEIYRVNKTSGAATFVGTIAGAGQFGLGGLSFTAPAAPSSDALFLRGDRFKVEATFRASGSDGVGHPVQLTSDTGYFWFFWASNVELVIKVLDGCGVNNRFWVFAGGLTNVRVDITVTDTATGAHRHYTNPQGTPFQPIQDTSAFATCS